MLQHLSGCHYHCQVCLPLFPTKDTKAYRETYIHDMQMYENKVYYVIGMFLDTRFIECVWMHLRRNHSSVVIQMTGICMKLSTLAWDL